MIELDEQSLLVHVAGDERLSDLEAELRLRGLTLGVAIEHGAADGAGPTVGEWIARGAPGAPSSFADPADQTIAGLTGTLGPRSVEVRPCPRRATGPDLLALFAGTGSALGRVERAWLRVHHEGAARPSLPLPALDLDPPVSAAEAGIVDAIARALG